MATHSSILAWESHDRGAWQALVYRFIELDTTEHTCYTYMYVCVHVCICINLSAILPTHPRTTESEFPGQGLQHPHLKAPIYGECTARVEKDCGQ